MSSTRPDIWCQRARAARRAAANLRQYAEACDALAAAGASATALADEVRSPGYTPLRQPNLRNVLDILRENGGGPMGLSQILQEMRERGLDPIRSSVARTLWSATNQGLVTSAGAHRYRLAKPGTGISGPEKD
ncbi:MAG TPA: hypothetical protein VED40_23035 [Azospirillaceae bacterium]|nr:hypothetical protein [Azospirillaceae bacterium]